MNIIALSPDALDKTLLGGVDGKSTYLVDGDEVKLLYDMDFVEGGNGLVYDFIPKDELWVEKNVPARDVPFILYHEAYEARLMEQGLSYEQAHEQANRSEKLLRQRAAVPALPSNRLKRHGTCSVASLRHGSCSVAFPLRSPSSSVYKAQGRPCKPGETQTQTDCVPQSREAAGEGEGTSLPLPSEGPRVPPGRGAWLDEQGGYHCYEGGREVDCAKLRATLVGRKPASKVPAGKLPLAPPGEGHGPVSVSPASHPGTAKGSTVTLAKTDARAWDGTHPVTLKLKLTKQETGRVGEAVVLAFLREIEGNTDARPMNEKDTNFPIDLIWDHEPTEVKAGLASNGPDAQKWRLTFSQESKEERAAYARMTPAQRTQWNAHKQQRIHERKAAKMQELAAALGRPPKPKTITVVLNPDTQTADLYKFDGFWDSIRWRSEETKRAYLGSYRYDHATRGEVG